MSELVQIEEIARIKQGRYTAPSELSEKPTNDAKVPVWGANGILGYTQHATYEEAQPLVTCRGNGCGLVQWTGVRSHVSNNAMAIVLKDVCPASSKYLYYSLLASKFDDVTTGSAQPQITVGHLNKKEIFWDSDRSERIAIAHILGTLDGKIELNQKMNLTLENIAEAIFKSWFVDFDPVRAKAEGRPTGLPAEISDLFPDELVNTAFREMPAGWNLKRLSDCEIQIESGRRPKGGIDKSLSNGVPSIGAESIASAGIFDFSKVKYVTEQFASKMNRGKVQSFDVALYKDGGKPGQFIPRAGVYGEGFPFSDCYVNEHVFLLRSKQLGQPFLYRMVLSDDFLNQLIAKGSAKAAQPGLNQEEVGSNELIVPTEPLLQVFNEMYESILRRQFLLGKETKVLSELRDTLLPKLISGELRIPDAEKFLEEVGI